MRLFVWLFVFLLFVSSTLAWTKEDYEIFDLVSALEASEGKGTTFYSWLDVSPSATASEIGRAYRKKSIQLHPDKNPGKKGAHERFARLGVIAQILRNPESRERYDFFYKNGVPRWRGTGYYYSRFRPGLGFVAVFLIVSTTGLHYLIQRLNYKSDLARIERVVREARQAAWGPKMVPLDGQRKVKVNMGGRAYVDEDGNVVNGRWLDMLVEGDGVFIIEDGHLLPVDESAATAPGLSRTWFISLILGMFQKLVGRKSEEAKSGGKSNTEIDEDNDDSTSVDEEVKEGSSLKTRVPATRAGGRRRKAVPPPRKRKEKEKETEH